ncbi:MAG: hypothetical protein HKL85_03690, partial [Acidimicrobiaceae bacterium]|nr:hypothetical protein [Acidimicrobiaceae bacterium]
MPPKPVWAAPLGIEVGELLDVEVPALLFTLVEIAPGFAVPTAVAPDTFLVAFFFLSVPLVEEPAGTGAPGLLFTFVVIGVGGVPGVVVVVTPFGTVVVVAPGVVVVVTPFGTVVVVAPG